MKQRFDEEVDNCLLYTSFGQTSIGAYKLGTMIKVSDELLNDSVFNLESYISTEFARRIGAKEEEAVSYTHLCLCSDYSKRQR